MFFRFIGERRKAIDLDDTFSGPCFLLGGAPSLKEVKDLLVNQPVVLAAMNNTATVVRPDIWVGLDVPANYSSSVLLDPSPMKFTYITRKDDLVEGKAWKNIPNTYFMSSTKQPNAAFFLKARDFCWGKNVFTIALQLLYRLGFRTVYTVGCEFNINKEYQYCYETKLNDNQVDWTKKTYDSALRGVREVLPLAEDVGFKLISCTMNSRLNDLVEYEDFHEVLGKLRALIPNPNTICRHPVD
jgi:hypothetical protein